MSTADSSTTQREPEFDPAGSIVTSQLNLHQIKFPDTPEMVRQFNAVADILKERQRQDKKWGEQNHNLNIFMSILTEEVGEAAKEVNDGTFAQKRAFEQAIEARKKSSGVGGQNASMNATESPLTYASRLRTEMVQVAAVALSILEYLDRNDGGSFL